MQPEFLQMRFFHHDKFTAFITPGDDRIFLQSIDHEVLSKLFSARLFATRDIWLDRELALLYQVTVLHASPSRVLGWLFL